MAWIIANSSRSRISGSLSQKCSTLKLNVSGSSAGKPFPFLLWGLPLAWLLMHAQRQNYKSRRGLLGLRASILIGLTSYLCYDQCS
mmetsp:Transcript_56823/g.122875  ORF Transcript_56823/g.122875 Transcript_56823/m.122875 type:complete len:86 (-) Transcript_56823:727-984(-)